MYDYRRGGSVLGAFLLGGLVGAVLGLLFAPRSGKETREIIADRAEDYWGQGVEMYGQGKEKAVELYETGKTQATEKTEALRTKIDEARDRLREQVATTSEAAKGTVEKAAEVTKSGVDVASDKTKGALDYVATKAKPADVAEPAVAPVADTLPEV